MVGSSGHPSASMEMGILVAALPERPLRTGGGLSTVSERLIRSKIEMSEETMRTI
jgi:hypothetical protein